MFTNFQASDTDGKRLKTGYIAPTNLAQKLSTRWFKVRFFIPQLEVTINHLKGHVFTTPKKLTISQNCEEKKSTQRYIGKLPTACVSGSKRVKAFFAICAARAHRARPDWTQLMAWYARVGSQLVCVATVPGVWAKWRFWMKNFGHSPTVGGHKKKPLYMEWQGAPIL